MKNKRLFLRGRTYGLLFAASLFLFSSCTIGEDGDSDFISDIQNSTLDAPEVVFESNADGTKTVCSWPLVKGAGGYQFTLYDVNDKESPIALVTDTVIDGLKMEIPRAADTNYELVAKTLGNDKYGNLNSEEKRIPFTTMIPALVDAPIPGGTDLTKWFAENKAKIDAASEEFAIELLAGAEYEMSGKVDMSQKQLTLRTNSKKNNAIIKLGENAGFETECGIFFKYVDFDCTNMTDPNSSILAYSKKHTISKTADHYLIHEGKQTVFQNCKIKNLQTRMIFDNQEPYAVQTALIQDCIIELDQEQQLQNKAHTCDYSYGFCFGFTLKNSTVYSVSEAKNTFFLQYSGKRPQQLCNGIYPTNTIDFLNNTMVNITKNSAMVSYGRLRGQKVCTLTVKNNIFVDCSQNRVARNFLAGQNGGMIHHFENNCYRYNNADTGSSDWDKKDRVVADPQLTQTSEGIYKVGGAEVKAAGIGDPRGLQ